MRFCMLTTFYPPYSFGGDAIFVRNLAEALVEKGHEVEVVHCRDAYRALARGTTDPGDLASNGVKVHALESRAGWLSPLATHQTGAPWFKVGRIRSILERGFDVIHYHNVSLVGGPELLAYGDALKLYTFHEYWLVCPTHLLFRNDREPCTRKTCFTCALAYHRPPQLWRHTRAIERAVENVDLFLSPSRFGMETHRRLGLDAPMVHLPTFVPDRASYQTATETEDERPYFLYAGRLEHAKGPQTLVSSFVAWNRADLVVAGAGSMEQSLRDLAGGSPRVRFEGLVDEDRLRRLYRGAVAVVVPSLSFEMFPLVVLEAFREGTPAIVRNRGAMPEAVEDSGGGLIYEDDAELRAHLETLLDDAALRAELGRRGREAYEQRYSTAAHLDRYLGIVDDLSKRRGAGART